MARISVHQLDAVDHGALEKALNDLLRDNPGARLVSVLPYVRVGTAMGGGTQGHYGVLEHTR